MKRRKTNVADDLRNRRIRRVSRIGVSCVFLFVLTLIDVWSDSLPQSIGSLKLEQIQSGEEARQEIDRLHGKTIRLQKGYIGSYEGATGSARLWVSEYGSQDEAVKAIENMAKGIREGRKGDFWHFQKKVVERIPVYFVVGTAQVHYFFQKGVRVIWLAVDPSLAEQGIRDVIRKMD